MLADHAPRPASEPWDERSAWLIAYPDQFVRPGEASLATLARVLETHLSPTITGVHVLPFHPSSSDGGFSITAHDTVDPAFGTWADVRTLAQSTMLMADAVMNHASAQGDWFTRFLAGEEPYRDFFRTVGPAADLSAVVRPRTTPAKTDFVRCDGRTASVWTTFSPDQVDLDYRSPEVLLKMLEVVLSYVTAGARAVRLDAVAFLWKVEGTSSIHLPETHAIVRLVRSCIDEVDPGVILVTETNVPHTENVSYFGEPGQREAQAVYQFPLPPLVLHAFVTGSAAVLRSWAACLGAGREDTTFLNFLASHDGVGLRPAEGLLDDRDFGRLMEVCGQAGGATSYREGPGGEPSPYELNATWYELMAAGHGEEAAMDRHVASHAVALALKGIPLLYTHAVLASGNNVAAFERTGSGRDLNRAQLSEPDLRELLSDPNSRAARSWSRIGSMLATRAASTAFHPGASQNVLDGPDELLIVHRRSQHENGEALVIVNVSDHPVRADLAEGRWIAGRRSRVEAVLDLPRWSTVWLTRRPER